MSTSVEPTSGEDTISKPIQTLEEENANGTAESFENSKKEDVNVTPDPPQTSKEGDNADAGSKSKEPQASEEQRGGDVKKPDKKTSDKKTSDVPDVPVTLESPDSEADPRVGMGFKSEEEAFKFYNSYAKRKGFSVRKGHVHRRRDGSIKNRHFLCSNEGIRREHRTHVTKKPRPLERTNCLAHIEFKVNDDNLWAVHRFVEEHNHPLVSANQIHLLRSHRKNLPIHCAFITELDYIGVKPAKGYEAKEEVDQVSEKSGFFMKNQSYYLLHSNRVRDLEKGDGQFLLDFLKSKQSEDPSFFYAVQVDEKDRLTNFFWADARSIFDYSCFGDVVLLDTTYRTSRYDIPFAPFIGINHHKQMVLFGAALLLDETVESFLWLFKTFMSAMSGRQPRTILTDNISSITKAISVTLPETYHQFCRWHIIQNAPKIVPHMFTHESNFQKEFESWVYEDRSEEELQKGWENLVSKYNLTSNPWFTDLHASHEKWCSVYCKNSFCATMTTKQWSESMGNHFKMLFYRKLPLSKFMVQYQLALNQLREKELSEDYKSRLAKFTLLADVPILIEASESYTRVMYKEFEEEYKSQLACLCEPVAMHGSICTFRVTFPLQQSFGLVEYDPSDVLVTCSCKKFETLGILCMHALKVLNYNNILHLPSCYILKRWTKYAKDGTEFDKNRTSIDPNDRDFLALRYSQVTRKAITVAVKSAFCKDALELVEHGLDQFMAQMEYELHKDASNIRHTEAANLVHSLQQTPIEAANLCFDAF